MNVRSWMTTLAIVGVGLPLGSARAFSLFGDDGLFPKLGAIVATPVISTVETVKAAVEKPTLENVGKAVIVPVVAVEATLKKTVDTVNDTVEKNPDLKKAIEGKQITVSMPIGDPPSTPPTSTSGSVGSRTATPDARTTTIAMPNSSGESKGGVSPSTVIVLDASVPLSATSGTTAANVATNIATFVGPPEPHVYGPSAIAEFPTKPKGIAHVPPDHPNKDQYYLIESTVEQSARELSLPGAPMTRSAYRAKDDGAHPSARHAFAAIDYSSVSAALAVLVSQKLGPCYFVQIEYPGVPDSEHQRVYPFVNGKALPPRDQSKRAGGNHTHVQLNEECVQ